MAESFTQPSTIGERLDSVIANIQTVSSTHVYATVIACSLAFSFYLLNSGGSSALTTMGVDTTQPIKTLPKKKSAQQSSSLNNNSPEPKWHILKITNYVAATGFLLSVLLFASNASTYLNDSTSLLQFLSVWSVFLCYFFGFFGISFIELDDFVVDEQQPQQTQGMHQPQQHVTPVRKNKVER